MSTKESLSLTSAQRTRQVAVVLWVTLILNWSVSLAKVAFGLVTNCMVIMADGIHSFSDGTSNVIGLIAMRFASHPADEDHPYGHEKYETLAATVIALLLFIVAFEIARKAVSSFFHPQLPEVNAVSFGIMGVTLVVNLFVVWYERKKGIELNSDFLISDSWHTLTDVFVTLAVIVALIGIALKFSYLDSIFSLGIAVIIVVVAIQLLKSNTDVLADKAVLDAGEVKAIVRGVPGVEDSHEIRTRGKMGQIYVDLHVLVDPEMSVRDSHELANRVELEIARKISGIRDVVVHIEPTTHEHDQEKA